MLRPYRGKEDGGAQADTVGKKACARLARPCESSRGDVNVALEEATEGAASPTIVGGRRQAAAIKSEAKRPT